MSLGLAAAPVPRRLGPVPLLAMLALLLAGMLMLALGLGAVPVPAARILAILLGTPAEPREATVLLAIRLPRAALAIAVGAALGCAGAALQGLFRNPLAEPALVGVSSGAALAAVATIVLAGSLPALPLLPPRLFLPAAAFAGGLAATAAALRLARAAGGGVAGLLLAGIAINAVASAGTGLLVTMSDDRQLRDITFWSMGSVAAGGWSGAAATAGCATLALLLLLPSARALDALLLGEAEARHLGVPVERLRLQVVTAVALSVGGAVAIAGIVGFVGLVVPHLVRLLAGPRHRTLLPASALLGGALMLGADTLARSAAAPAELPVGLVTSALGGPFFIGLLLTRRVDARRG